MRAGSCSKRCRRSSPKSGGCCTPAAACAWPDAAAHVGSIVVHVVLDYGNLPFLAAQNPYVGLLRATAPRRRAGRPATTSRLRSTAGAGAPLFASGGDAWPLSDALFARLAASRDAVLGDDRGPRRRRRTSTC